MNLIFIPIWEPQIGFHLGIRYFFCDDLGVFFEGGWANNLNYIKLGMSIK